MRYEREFALRVRRNSNQAVEPIVSMAESWVTVLAGPPPIDGLVALMKAAERGVRAELILCPVGIGELARSGELALVAASGVLVLRAEELLVHLVLTERAVLFRLAGSSTAVGSGTTLDMPTRHELHAAATRFVEEQVRPSCRVPKDLERAVAEERPGARSTGGYCIQCSARIPLCIGAPFCRADYLEWARKPDPFLLKSYCHRCGNFTPTTAFICPLCTGCQMASGERGGDRRRKC